MDFEGADNENGLQNFEGSSLLSEDEKERNEDVSGGAESPRSAALRAMGIHAVALQVTRYHLNTIAEVVVSQELLATQLDIFKK